MKRKSSQTTNVSFKGGLTCERLMISLDSIFHNFHNPYSTFSPDIASSLNGTSKAHFSDLAPISPFNLSINNETEKSIKAHNRLRIKTNNPTIPGYKSWKNILILNKKTDSPKRNVELLIKSQSNKSFTTTIRPKSTYKPQTLKSCKFFREFGKSFNKNTGGSGIPDANSKLEIEGKEQIIFKPTIYQIQSKRQIHTANKTNCGKSEQKLNKSISCHLDSQQDLIIDKPIIKVTAKHDFSIKKKLIKSQISEDEIKP